MKQKDVASAISPLMQTLSAYVAGAARRPLPAAVQERAKHHLLDTLAAMVSGAPLLPGQRAIAFAAAQGGTPEAGVIGTSIVTSAINAALANGMLGHADETDDAYYLALVHPGCAVVPAAWPWASASAAAAPRCCAP
jgi:2-methylcitrate dehydratase PrpD